MMADTANANSSGMDAAVPLNADRKLRRKGLQRMLSRQRAILALLAEAGGTATRLEATKWAFLLREETPSRGGSAFFQFLPYKYGPFSFSLYQEATALARNGYLREVDDRTWSITTSGRTAARDLAAAVGDDVRHIVRRFKDKETKELFGYVYDRYKWFTINSANDARMKRPEAAPAVYTAGYEGLSVDGFLDGLLRAGVRQLIDVRNNPVSRRYGFHRSTLHRLCGNVGIEYHHFPGLGIQSAERQDLDGPGARQALFDRYQHITLLAQGHAIGQVGVLLRQKSGVLVCMEADHVCCHRSRLADAVAQATGLQVWHLRLAQ